MPILLKFVLENAGGNRYYFTIDIVAVKPVKWWYSRPASKLVNASIYNFTIFYQRMAFVGKNLQT